MTSPTSGWEKLGDSFFSTTRLYDVSLSKEIEWSDSLVVGAEYGGAIARDHDSIQAFQSKSRQASSIHVIDSLGRIIQHLKWDRKVFRGIGWASDERLIIVCEDGSVRCYRNLQEDFSEFSLGLTVQAQKVQSCRFWRSGFVARLTDGTLISVVDLDEPRPKRLAATPDASCHAWSIISPSFTLSRSVEVLLAIDQTIYSVDESVCEDRALPHGPYVQLSISPDGQSIALLTAENRLWMVSSDFQNRLCEHASSAKSQPRNMVWCGNSAIILAWEDEVHLIDTSGGALKFYYEALIYVLPDVDGARIMSSESCDFIQRIPAALEDAFKIGSTSPISVLQDAVGLLEHKSPKADENLDVIRSQLPDAVSGCILAAGHAYSAQWQAHLLKAASFGKSNLSFFDSDEFVATCDDLRVLNAVRNYQIGIPLTIVQYQALTSECLIQRLINRQHYLLAARLCEFLKLPRHRIYNQWACRMVMESSKTDRELYDALMSRLKDKGPISFDEIAQTAYETGRAQLALMLLLHETRAARQVRLMLSMGENSVALEKSVESGDVNLVMFVILHLKSKLDMTSLLSMVTKAHAMSIMVSMAQQDDEILLKDIFYQDDNRLKGANVSISQALDQLAPQSKIDKLKIAEIGLSDSTKDANILFTRQSIKDTERLLTYQMSLESSQAQPSARTWVGLSLNQTIFDLTTVGDSKAAHKLALDFGMPSPIFERVRLRALISARRFTELEDIAHKVKKSAIGWEAYFNETLNAGNTKLAGNVFVPKCTSRSARQRAEMWVKCGMVSRAGEELSRLKDIAGLEELKNQAGAKGTMELDRLIADLKSQK